MDKNKLYKYSLIQRILNIIVCLVFLFVSIIFLVSEEKLLPKASNLSNLLFEIFATIIFLSLFIYTLYTNEKSYLYLDLNNKKFVLNYVGGKKIYYEEYFPNIEKIEARRGNKKEYKEYSIHVIWKEYDKVIYTKYSNREIINIKRTVKRLNQYFDYCNEVIKKSNEEIKNG